MRFAIRLLLVALGVATVGIAYALLRNVPEIVAVWPYPQSYGLSNVFIASMLAAIGAPIVWIGLSGDLAAIRSGAINIMAVSGGLGAQAVWKVAAGDSTERLLTFAIAACSLALVSAVLLLLTRKEPWLDPRPTPWLARGAFALFAFVLLIAGGLLVQRIQIFPWVLTRDNAIAYGIIFLGSAAYFIHAIVEPVWSNARGQLLGFLAYDAVLLVPYARLWPSTAGDQQLGLAIYLGVIALSGVIAIWFLFFNPIWKFGRGLRDPIRDWRRRGPPADTVDAI
jgi:hypothetical protein